MPNLSWPLFYLVGLGPRCTCPICSLGGGRLCQRVWSAQPAQDWLRPGGPPHTCKSSILVSAVLLSLGIKGCKFCRPFFAETGFCRCCHWLPGTGPGGCLWDGLYWQKLWQIQVRIRGYPFVFQTRRYPITQNTSHVLPYTNIYGSWILTAE